MIVQSLHTLVKDFLLENSHLLLLRVQSGKEMLALANDQLARSCFNFGEAMTCATTRMLGDMHGAAAVTAYFEAIILY